MFKFFKISPMDSLKNYLSYGAPLARATSSAKNSLLNVEEFHWS